MLNASFLFYREQPVLWNVKIKEYRDRNVKEIEPGKKVQAVKHSNENITLDQINKQLHTLSSQFLKENKLTRDYKIWSRNRRYLVPSLGAFT